MRTPEPSAFPPLEPPPVEEFPPALPLDPILPDVLAYTGPGDELLSWLIVVASGLILGGLVVAAFQWIGGDE